MGFIVHFIKSPNIYVYCIRPKILTTNAKVDKREVGKEQKALKAAQLDRAIENELLERLKQVTDTEIYNYPERQYSKALSRATGKFQKGYLLASC